MYVTTAWSKVYAFDARTGKPLWTYDPKVPPEWGVPAAATWSIAALPPGEERCSSAPRWPAGRARCAQRQGRLGNNTIDRSKAYSITGAPRIANGRVIIGNAGSEFGVRGYLSAYDADNGKVLWRFCTVPGDPSKAFETAGAAWAAKTWKGGEWWKTGGGGTVWDAIAYDPDTEPGLFRHWQRRALGRRRSAAPGGGDNLFLPRS